MNKLAFASLFLLALVVNAAGQSVQVYNTTNGASDTAVTQAATQTLTNKTLIISTPIQSTTYSYATPTTGQTVTIADTADTAIIEPAGTLATLTVTLPTCSAPYDGKRAGFSSTQIITALTVGATAGTVVDGAGSLAVGGGNQYLCRGSTAKWYRAL